MSCRYWGSTVLGFEMMLRGLGVLSLGLIIAGSASAQTFNQLVGFGDSSLDSGYFRYTSTGWSIEARYVTARANGASITPSAGLMNTDFLAASFGLTLAPSSAPGGGTNFAVSGAENNSRNIGGGPSPSTVQQINNYLASTGGQANPDALYIIRSGGNDRAAFVAAYKAANGGASPPPGLFNIAVQPSLAALEASIRQLSAAGARYMILPTYFTTNSDFVSYHQQLWNDLSAAGVRFIPADSGALRQYVVANPAAFGLTSVLPTTSGGVSACNTPIGAPASQGYGLICVPSTTPAGAGANGTAYLNAQNSLQTSLFSDDQHLSPVGQKIEADYFYSLIVAPSQISFLAEAPVKTRLGVINAITNQIPLSFGTPGAFHGWASGDLSWLKATNSYAGFPDDPGTPIATSAGFDYAISRDWLVGAAFSGGYARQTFSLGGDFKQTEFAVSLYTAYRRNDLWINAIGTWGSLQDTINRQVPIGITVQSNNGRTSGTNISFAAEGGYNFRTAIGDAATNMPVKAPASAAIVTHGPVVGLILQQVHIGAFAESNPSGAPTNLAFGAQTRNSAVTELGYQASLAMGRWEPYAKAVWNHELADTGRLVTASLLSITAPSYSLPAVLLGKDWGTVTAGTRFKFAPNAIAYAAFNSQVGQGNVTTYGGQIGVNVALGSPPAVRAKY
jgi:outer membrane lipase/esterase